jgi:arylsulfatase
MLEAAGLPFPRVVNGTEQRPFEGVSFLYALNDAAAKDRHTTQYFEIAGNRAIYHEGWLARTIHRAPWEPLPRAPLAEDVWQLYDTRNDFSLANDLAAREPRRLEELKALFLAEAVKYDVLPIDDRTLERLNPSIAGRPDLMGGRTSITLYEGMTGMFENAFLNVKNRSSSIRADLEVPGGARGVVLAQGGRFGGWSLYLDGGRPTYVYNFVGLERTVVAAPEALAAGAHEVSVDFAYEGGGLGKGATVTVLVDGKQVAQGRVPRTTPNVFSGDEGADVGIDEDTPVAEAYQAGAPSRFTGRIRKVVLEVR